MEWKKYSDHPVKEGTLDDRLCVLMQEDVGGQMKHDMFPVSSLPDFVGDPEKAYYIILPDEPLDKFPLKFRQWLRGYRIPDPCVVFDPDQKWHVAKQFLTIPALLALWKSITTFLASKDK